MSLPLAVVGAGLSGLTAAVQLQQAGQDIVVFDKGRRVAGRMSTRLALHDASDGAQFDHGPQFDHGAQYFTVRSPEFQEQVNHWIKSGVVAPWEAKVAVLTHRMGEPAEVDGKQDAAATTRYVGVPGMNALCLQLAEQLSDNGALVHSGVEVNRLLPTADGVQLWSGARLLGTFAQVLVAIPAPQAALLLADDEALAAKISQAKLSGCWATMVAFNERLPLEYDAAFVNPADDGDFVPLSWIARDSSKPGRTAGGAAGDCWVLHGSPAWSEANLERTKEDIAADLLATFCEATGVAHETISKPAYLRAHRWRYALPSEPLEERFLQSNDLRLFASGDWCGGPRVEGAYLSGLRVADAMLSR